MDTALLAKQIFKGFFFFLPQFFFSGAEGDATNGHLNLLVISFCWCTTPPILSLSLSPLTSALSAVVACSV